MRIRFDNEYDIPLSTSDTLLKQALAHGVPLTHSCGGNARCSTCRVVVLEGELPPRNALEKALADRLGLPDIVRLACQLPAATSMRVRRVIRDSLDHQFLAQSAEARERNVAILCSDVRGFTNFCERHLPYDVVHALNRYFRAMGSAVTSNGGRVDKYMGDGVLAVFGLDDTSAHPAVLALRAARAMLAALPGFNAYLGDAFSERFAIGIGIHYGPVVVGRIGHDASAPVTVIGDTVNVAARLESATKDLAPVLLSEEAYLATGEQGFASHVVALKGKSGPTRAFALPE